MATAPKTPPKVHQMPASGDLKKRMTAQTAQAGASLEAPPPPPEKEAIPELAEVVKDAAARLKIRRLVKTYLDWSEHKREATNALKPLTANLKVLLGKNKVGKMMCDGIQVSYYDVPRSKLSETKLRGFLAALGVEEDVVEKCITTITETKPCYTLKIRVPKAGADEVEEEEE